MSRLHAIVADVDQIAARFGIEQVPQVAVPSETIEGGPGLVLMKVSAGRALRSATWGFPRPTVSALGIGGPERIGLVADLTNPMWEELVRAPKYRCLIPITHFANPDGDPGHKTRTWFSVADQPIMAWAGFCRNLPGLGPVYAGMTMEANAAIPPTNDRMPVLLEDHEWDQWFDGTIRDVIRFQFRAPMAGDRMRVERTADLWRSGARPPGGAPQLALL